MLPFGNPSGARELPQDPDWPIYLYVHLEACFRLDVCVWVFWAFLRMECSFPCFPKAQHLLSTLAPTCPIFPGRTLFLGVSPLFPDLSSDVLIMGLEIVVVVMIALSKPCNHQVKRGWLVGVSEHSNWVFATGDPPHPRWEAEGSAPARTCFPEKAESRQTKPCADGTQWALWGKVATPEGLALVSPSGTSRGHLLEITEIPLSSSHHMPKSKIKCINECKAGKGRSHFE